MLAVLVFWIILFCIFLALGDAFVHLYNRLSNQAEKLSTTSTFFIGLAIAGFISCTLSLFVPLTTQLFIGIFILVCIYWAIRRKSLFNYIGNGIRLFKKSNLLGKILYVFIGFVVLYHASSFSSSFDQFLYHQQHIKWLQEYGIVPGLANLHLRFGFNSSSLSIVSLFAYLPDIKISFTALNGLCLFIFSYWLINLAGKERGVLSSAIFIITLIVFVHFYAMELSSTSTDIIVNILVAYLLLNCLFEKDNLEGIYLPLAVLPIFCVTLKLSSAPIVILSLYAYYHLLKSKEVKSLLFCILLSGIILIPWLIQNVILTGYLIFPFPAIDIFSFDWKVPTEIVDAEKTNTYYWAKGTAGDSLLGWIPQWWQNHLSLMDKIIYILALCSSVIFIFLMRWFNKKPLLFIGCLTAIIGSLFVFATAPALRFSLGFTLSAVFIALFPLCSKSNSALNLGSMLTQYALLFAFAVFHLYYIGSKVSEKVQIGRAYVQAQFIKPFPLSYAIKDTQFDKVNIDAIDVYIPKEKGQCFDHELPCTPAIINNLELRGEDISDGFRIRQK